MQLGHLAFLHSAVKRGNPGSELLALLLATHPQGAPELAYHQGVKYARDIQKWARPERDIEMANDLVTSRVPLVHVEHGRLSGGRCFGVDVSVAWWLFDGTSLKHHVG